MARNDVGQVFVGVNNAPFRIAESAVEIDIGGNETEELVGLDGSVRYKKTPKNGYVKGTGAYEAGLDLAAIRNTSGETVQVELACGDVYAVLDATFVGQTALNVQDGTFPFQFNGTVKRIKVGQ